MLRGFGNNGGVPTNYLFIDGGYLDKFAENAGKAWFGCPAVIDYERMSSILQGRKTFYYDCLPAKTDAETDEQFKEKTAIKEAHFDRLRGLPGWHVSEGLAKWKKKVGSTQKEVDILIAVDMLTHAYRKNMDSLTFVAGDQDFRPLLEAVVRDGMYVKLYYGAMSISPELKHSADTALAIGPYELQSYCTDAFVAFNPLPAREIITARPHGQLLEVGSRDGIEAAWIVRTIGGPRGEQITLAGAISPGNDRLMGYWGANTERMKIIYEADYGPCVWAVLPQLAT